MSQDSITERLTRQLGLIPHPSGSGVFRETFRGGRQVTFIDKDSNKGPRSTGTVVYFLLEAPNVVKWHRHNSDSAFFWHAGEKVNFHVLHNDEGLTCHVLGDVVMNPDCVAHINIPHNTWYSTEIAKDTCFCLYSCCVMPGFEFEDWSEGKQEDLVRQFPQHEDIITRLA